MSANPWHFIDNFPGECAAEVSRKGNSEPCDKAACAVAFDAEGYWPVCSRHTQGQALLTLGEIINHGKGPSCTCPSWGNPSWPHRHGCPVGDGIATPSMADIRRLEIFIESLSRRMDVLEASTESEDE